MDELLLDPLEDSLFPSLIICRVPVIFGLVGYVAVEAFT
jgi:hypothetical protein